ncbi:MAG: hypothetical protein V7K92_23220 [Nostoc sp.]|uniref:hypothetical protein n=1 Tax=Nostoc sp. TaxID=1180 RepID=UPI002FF3C237
MGLRSSTQPTQLKVFGANTKRIGRSLLATKSPGNRIRGYTDKTHLRGLKILHLELLQAMLTAANYATF